MKIGTTEADTIRELRRMTCLFQARALAAVMGIKPPTDIDMTPPPPRLVRGAIQQGETM